MRVISFVWGKMRTAAHEIAPQIALRHCSKETQGEGQYTCDFGEGRIHIQSSTYFSKGFY